ncbi:MAG: alanine racemase [candidate division NC10 bacterium]|nr:alanine racemase [candidate division NC10 bacterium]
MRASMLTYQNGRLQVDGLSAERLAETLGTPVFLFSESTLKGNYAALARGLSVAGEPATIRYCAKTNNEPAILSHLAAWGSEALVSHPAEAELALRCGFSADRLAYQRPVLLPEDLRAVIRMGITLLHASDLADVELIEKAACDLDRRVRVSLRVRTEGFGTRLSPLGFLARRLGLARRDLVQVAARVKQSDRLTLSGINAYIGTQQESVDRYRALVRELVRIGLRLAGEMDLPLEEINIGGGIPSPQVGRMRIGRLWRRFKDDVSCQAPLHSLEEYAREIARSYREAADRLSPRPRLVAELGRSVIGSAAVLLTRVRAIRGRWAFVDASRHFLPESPLLFCRRVLPATEPRPGHPQRFYHLSGATLDTLDVLGVRRRLPALRVGDLLVLCDAGAYSVSRATRYAGLLPAVCLVAGDGSWREIRRAEGLSELTGTVGMDAPPGAGT